MNTENSPIEHLDDADEVVILMTEKSKLDTLNKIGYDIDEDGYIVDNTTKKQILIENEPIKYTEPGLAISNGGSHVFTRNAVDYARHLAKKNKLNFIANE